MEGTWRGPSQFRYEPGDQTQAMRSAEVLDEGRKQAELAWVQATDGQVQLGKQDRARGQGTGN